jgi:ATP-dependent Clp protease ATP-binding subunit ClpC
MGIVKSNDPRAEFTDENDDDFDEEKKYSQSKGAAKQSNAKSKTPVLDNFGP